VIQDVDEALRTLLRRDALAGTDVEVALDAPTTEWSSRRNSPTLDLYLYDIREDVRMRENGLIDVRDDEGRVVRRDRPPRYYKLSYLVTAWTQRPEDEHRLLAAVLACMIRHDKLPDDVLGGQLEGIRLPVPVTIAHPPPQDRALSEVWTALGGDLKPSLDLVVSAPFDVSRLDHVGPPVLEPIRLGVSAPGAKEARKGRGGRRRPTVKPIEPPVETVIGGSPELPGRTFRIEGRPQRPHSTSGPAAG
jgi:hypothetical protein